MMVEINRRSAKDVEKRERSLVVFSRTGHEREPSSLCEIPKVYIIRIA